MADFEFGGIVGVAFIVDCVRVSASVRFVGDHEFVLADACGLLFRPCRGRLGLFEVECAALPTLGGGEHERPRLFGPTGEVG